MAGTDLILLGTTTIGGVDCSAEITLVILKGFTADVVIPATLTQGITHAGGANHYTVQIDYLSDDASTGLLFPILWTAVGSVSKELTGVSRFRAGAETPSNPQWTYTFVVDAASVGGQLEGLSTGSFTATLTGAPTLLNS